MIGGVEKLDPSNATEFDVASYIIESLGAVTTLKLQMLLFFCQAFSLAWDERPMFATDFHACDVGPKLSSIHACLGGMFEADSSLLAGNPTALDEDAVDTVDEVLKIFGDKSSQWLGRTVRMHEPWRQAWESRSESEVGINVIEKPAIQAFYSSL